MSNKPIDELAKHHKIPTEKMPLPILGHLSVAAPSSHEGSTSPSKNSSMDWRLAVAKRAQKIFTRLPARDQTRIEAALDQLTRKPFTADVKRLKPGSTEFSLKDRASSIMVCPVVQVRKTPLRVNLARRLKLEFLRFLRFPRV